MFGKVVSVSFYAHLVQVQDTGRMQNGTRHSICLSASIRKRFTWSVCSNHKTTPGVTQSPPQPFFGMAHSATSQKTAAEETRCQVTSSTFFTFFAIFIFTLGSIEALVVKFADGGPKKRQQTQQNHGNVQFICSQFCGQFCFWSKFCQSSFFVPSFTVHYHNKYGTLKTKNRTGVK